MAFSKELAPKTLAGAAERTAAAIREAVITPAEAIIASIERISAMRLPADVQTSVTGELDILAGDLRLRLISETRALWRLGETLGRFERRLLVKST